MTYRVAVALGSNLGPRREHMRRAVRALGEFGVVESVSTLYETAPVGGPEQGAYLNAVAVVTTELQPSDLLHELLCVEQRGGRVRDERWGPRTLDLDLVAATDQTGEWVQIRTDELQLPHPRAHLRRFILEPLIEVWPEARLEGGVPAVDLLGNVADQQVEVLERDWTA